MKEQIIPKYRTCFHKGCLGTATLDEKVYHFLNTGKPYMLRHCSKCGVYFLVLID